MSAIGPADKMAYMSLPDLEIAAANECFTLHESLTRCKPPSAYLESRRPPVCNLRVNRHPLVMHSHSQHLHTRPGALSIDERRGKACPRAVDSGQARRADATLPCSNRAHRLNDKQTIAKFLTYLMDSRFLDFYSLVSLCSTCLLCVEVTVFSSRAWHSVMPEGSTV